MLHEQICERFKRQWRAGRTPRIEDYLDSLREPEHAQLLRALLSVELSYRRQQGESPATADYVARFPQFDAVVRECFAADGVGTPPDRQVESLATTVDYREPAAEPSDSAGGAEHDLYNQDSGSGSSSPDTRPQRWGRYRIVGDLGVGGSGAVYLGEDEQLGRQVAIKVPHAKLLNSPGAVESFQESARIWAALDHPHIVPVYDYGQLDDGRCYVVSKYIDGGSLERRSADGPLALDEAVRTVAAVADALHYTHQQGLVHRDVKPANILLDRSGRPLLADFGLALHDDQQRLRRNEISGTFAYMAPEQTRGESHRLDGRADIWSLGVVLYQLLTGRRPFDGSGMAELFDEIRHREPKPPRQVRDTLPLELERITLRCLSKAVTDRYSTAADLSADLRNWLAAQESATLPVKLAASELKRTRPQRRWALVSATVLVLAPIALGAGLFRAGIIPGSAGPEPNPVASGSEDQVTEVEATSPLDGTVDVVVWDPQDPARRRLSLVEAGALPLRRDDQIRVEARVDRPMFLYVLWIGSDGQVLPVYPWRPGDWTSRTSHEPLRDRLSLPEDPDEGWEMDGPAGMETLVLLARDAPLPDDFDLAARLADLPPTQLAHERLIVWFDQGETRRHDQLRAPKFMETVPIDDPVLVIQRQIKDRLESDFTLIRAVSFANRGAVDP